MAGVVSQPINAWLSLLSALLLRSVGMSGATAAGPGLAVPRAGLGEPGRPGEPRSAGERRRPRRHPVAGAHGASAGRARPSPGPPRPLPARAASSGFSRRSPPPSFPLSVSLR